MKIIARDEKIRCVNCYQAYLECVVKDYFIETDNITVPNILTLVCPKCKEEFLSFEAASEIDDYLEKEFGTSEN